MTVAELRGGLAALFPLWSPQAGCLGAPCMNVSMHIYWTGWCCMVPALVRRSECAVAPGYARVHRGTRRRCVARDEADRRELVQD